MKPIFKRGEPISYGLFDGRQIPCTVAASYPDNGLPSLVIVRETIPHLCKAGARIPIEREFYADISISQP